jgi:hypothetical protein
VCFSPNLYRALKDFLTFSLLLIKLHNPKIKHHFQNAADSRPTIRSNGDN